jgi:hypothetical protein
VGDEDLDDGGDDRRAAGGADRELGLAVAQRDDRAYARPRLLAGRRRFGSYAPGEDGAKSKSVSSSLSRKP